MICYPNAKINLGLNVVEKRADGFHNIESLFLPIRLADILELLPATNLKSGKFELIESGIKIESEATENLVVKAYSLLAEDYNLPAVRIALHKQIPWGAGLGGGSSDAASMVMALNRLFDLNLSDDKFSTYLEQLGSDCSFFKKNQVSFVTGRGEILNPVDIKLKSFFLVVVVHDVNINTAKAYSLITPKKPEIQLLKCISEDTLKWRSHIRNDFEEAIFPDQPRLKQIK
ncbi:MAG: 4-(cytidine 5'-diphospho)-2-C-methyl-D-erythritol kinase, partial [Bacteroidota bacterium]|nr:4-(cytidine 5'-diphospho)-2-C-methyl-D-erythritol kinase [Bacteroidota bacterium]